THQPILLEGRLGKRTPRYLRAVASESKSLALERTSGSACSTNTASSASAIASLSPTGTNRPHLPSSSISLAPPTLLVLTTAVPQASACMSAFGQPSVMEELTKTLARRIHGNGFAKNPGR